MKQQTRVVLAAAAVLAATGTMTACSSLGGADPYAEKTSSAPAAPAPTQPPSDTGSTAAGKASAPAENTPAFALALTRTKALGWIVTDGGGWALYRFDKDRAQPAPKPSCSGACASKWPPVLWRGSPELGGVPASLVGKIRRADGTWQLTLHGWPVYRFAGDARPGQWKGQGVGGTWHTIMRNGGRNLAKAAAAAPAASPAPQPTITDGYGNSSY